MYLGLWLANPTTRTPEKDEAILAALRLHPSKSRACRTAKVPRQTFYDWLAADPDFKARVAVAQAIGIDAIEDSLLTDAVDHNTTAAIFALKTWRKERYGDKLEHTGKDEGPIEFLYREIPSASQPAKGG